MRVQCQNLLEMGCVGNALEPLSVESSDKYRQAVARLDSVFEVVGCKHHEKAFSNLGMDSGLLQRGCGSATPHARRVILKHCPGSDNRQVWIM